MMALTCMVMAASASLGQAVFGPPPEASNPATEALVRQVALEAERLRESLEHAERVADYAPLLERKLTVDGSLMAALLLEDAAEFREAVAAGREPRGLLRALCVEFGDAGLLAEWSHPEGPAWVSEALRCWSARPGGVAACRAASASLHAADGEQAPWISWTVEAEGEPGAPRMSATAHWHEPCLENTRLDWPLEPRALVVGWNESGAWLRTDGGAAWTESWPAEAIFNNPPELYALFDALRWRRAGDARTTSAAPDERAPAATAPPGVVTRTLRRRDGSLVRREHWEWTGSSLRRLRIEQPPLRLLHHAPLAFDLHQVVEGEPSAPTQAVHPSAVLAHPAGGMSIEVSFRSPTAERDAVECEAIGATVPERIELRCGDVPRALVEIRGVAAGYSAEGRARARRVLEGWQADEAASMRHRQRMAEDALAACSRGDALAVHAVCDALGALSRADGVPPQWTNANRRIAQRHLVETGFEAEAAALAVWGAHDEHDPEGPGDATTSPEHTAHFGEEQRALLAAWQRAMSSVAQALAARPFGRAEPQQAAERAARTAREIRQAGERFARAATPAAIEAIVQSQRGDAAAMASQCAQLATRIEADAMALCALGALGAQTDDVETWTLALQDALRGPPMPDAERSARRDGVRRLARAAGEVARGRMLECGASRAEATASEHLTRDRVMAYEGLAGNCLQAAAIGDWVVQATDDEMTAMMRSSPLVRGAQPIAPAVQAALPASKRLDAVAMSVVAAAWQCLSLSRDRPSATAPAAAEPNGPPKRPPSDSSPPPPRPKPPDGARSAAGTQSQRPKWERAPEGTRRDP
jgi:hypothetical protein